MKLIRGTMTFKTHKEFHEHIQRMKNDPEYVKEFKNQQDAYLRNYWMKLKPFQIETDVPELPIMNDFYINRLIELGAVPKSDLEDGIWYYGGYRNSNTGKWNKKTQKFDHYRWKFEWREDDCNHFEDDNGYALFVPLRKANQEELEQIEKIRKEYEKL